jgi:hypothetical protein
LKANLASKVLRFAVSFALGATVGVGAVVLAKSTPEPVLGVLLFAGIFIASVVVHEGGHVLGALSQGCDVGWVGIGPFVLERRRRGFRVHLRRMRMAGFVLSIPDFERDVFVQQRIVAAAGPAANLIVALVLLAVAWEFPGHPGSVGSLALWVAFALNVALGLGNLVPLDAPTKTDGALLLHYAKRVESDELRLLRLYDDSRRGRIASEYSATELASLEASPHAALSFLASYMMLRAAQQRGDREGFAAVLARTRAKVEQWDKATYARMRDLWMLFLIEEAFERGREGDAAAVEAFLADYGAFARSNRHRVEAVRDLARNDLARASRSIERARAEVDNTRDLATRRSGAALLAELAGELERRRAAVA